MDPAIEIENIYKYYGQKVALSNITYSVPSGSVHGLLGPNGAGKSTLASIIAGLIRPDSGAVRIMGQIQGEEIRLKRDVGFVSASLALFDDLTVLEHLNVAALLYSIDQKRCDSLIDEWDMKSYKNLLVRELSTGLAKKLALMLAIFNEPLILILDEPFSGLDPIAVIFLKNKIRTWKMQGKTVIIVGHQLDILDQLIDGYAILEYGHLRAASIIEENGTNRPRLEDLYMIHTITNAKQNI